MTERDCGSDARGLEFPPQPDGALSGTFWKYDRRGAAVRTHAAFEGYDVPYRAALEGYDRALHPWIRGWRPGEIGETVRSILERWFR